MQDNEIINALECCAKLNHNNWSDNMKICKEECPYKANCYDEENNINMITDALDLINRQQTEIERLKAEQLNCIEEVVKNRKIYEQFRSVDKADAIKEFASEFEYEIIHKEFWKDHPHTSQVWLNGYEQCMRDIRVMLKDKTKEMVGEE